jgi:serine/threonine-protein kinase HipA
VKPSDLKRVERATVLKAGRPAAELFRAGGGIRFEYRADYSGPPVAFSLPREAPPVHTLGGAVPPFFAGLLPEGRRLTAIQRATKTSLDDELTLLLAVGSDTAGDVQVMPEGTPGAVLAPGAAASQTQVSPVVQRFEDADFEELFAAATGSELRDRAALAGVQDKLSAWITIALPIGWEGASWILKLDPQEYPHLVANEACCYAAARASGLEVANTRVVHDRNGRSGLLVQRFDREPSAEGLHALALEDGCQVLGRYPADKYLVSSEELLTALARCCAAPLVAARDLLRQFAFAYLTGNGDLHAKNLSILQRGEWRAAPAYDLPSSLPYGDQTMALPIMGRSGNDIRRQDFIALGQSAGLPEKATVRVLDHLLAKLPTWLPTIATLPFERRTTTKLLRTIELRASRLGAKHRA